MLEVRERQLALDQQHARVHAERAVAAERDHRALRRAERNAGRKQRRETDPGLEIEYALGLWRDLPPQLRAIAGRGDDNLVREPPGKKFEAGLEVHLRPRPARARA